MDDTAHNPRVGSSRQKKALRNLIIIGVVLVFAGGGYWYFRNSFSLPLQDIVSFENSVQKSVLSEVTKDISAPPPLKVAKKPPIAQTTALTNAGVIRETNDARAQNGNLPALNENPTLDDVATLRLDDMFAKQYFAHVAPGTGDSAITVAKTVGYVYLALGENLALGNFTGDKDVVTAWMNSPGHRANILNTHYTQIGVAERKGMFQGSNEWIAVQIFGKPASDCPAPDASLKANIDASEAQLTQMNADLQAKKAAIDAMQPQYGEAYNQKVSEYNAEAGQYNTLAAEMKTAIAQYNAEVQTFNQCIGT